MKRIVTYIGVVFGLILAVIIIAPSFVDWNQYRAEIAQQVEALVGRPVTIEGDLDFAILPSPALSVKGVRIANVPGASTVDLVTLESLDIEVSFLPLLRGVFQVERTVLVAPTINLETMLDGRNNWDQPDNVGVATGEADDEGGFQVTLDSLHIERGAINYIDANSGTQQKLENINASVSAKSIWGPYIVVGEMGFGSIPTKIDLSVGDVSKSRVSIDATLGVSGGELEVTLSGVGYLDDTALLFEGALDVSIADSRALIGTVMDNDAITNKSGVPVTLSGRASITTESLAYENVDIVYGTVKGHGEVGVTFGSTTEDDPTHYKVIVSLPVIELDDLMADFQDIASSPSDDGGADTAPFALPADVEASLDVTIEGIRFDGKLARQVRAAVTLEDQQVTVRSLRALLPGGSDLSINGVLSAVNGNPEFKGQMRAGSSNLRTMLAAFDVNLDAVPKDRLTQMIMRSTLAVSGGVVQLGDVDFKIDTTTLTGGVAYALGRDRLSFGIDLVADRFNADVYMLPETAPEQEPFDILSLVNDLMGVDVNGTFKVNRLTYQRERIADLLVEFVVAEDQIVFTNLGASNVAGATVNLTGTTVKGGDVLGVEGNLHVETDDLSRLRRFAGLGDLPIGLNARRLDLSMDFSIRGDDMSLDGQAMLDDTKLVVRGNAQGQEGGSSTTNIQIELENESWSRFARMTGLDMVTSVAGMDVPVIIRGTIVGTGDRYDINLGMDLGTGRVSVSGNIVAAEDSLNVDLATSVQSPELVSLLGAIGFDVASPEMSKQGMNLSAAIRGSTDQLSLEGLNVQIGPTVFTGAMTADLRGDVPVILAALDFDKLDIGAFMGPPETGAEEARRSQQLRWSTEPIDLSSLASVDATIDLTARELLFHEYQFKALKLRVQASQKGLQIIDMSADLFGGQMTFSGALKSGDAPALDVSLRLTDASVAQALAAAADLTVATGKLTLSADIKGKGRSQKALVSDLNGSVDLLAENGVVQGVDMVRLSETMLSLVEYDDFIKLTKTALGGGETKYERFHAPFKVARGVAKTGPEIAVLEASQATVNATINLPKWALDADINFKLTEPGHEKTPTIGMRLYGAIDDPKQQIKAGAMTAYISRRLAGRLLDDFSRDGGNSGLRQLLGAPSTKSVAPAAEGATPDGQGAAPAEEAQPSQANPFDMLMRGLFNEIEKSQSKDNAKP